MIDKFISKLIRFLLFLSFLSYFFVAILVNMARLELYIQPLRILHLEKVECNKNRTICIGSYPDKKLLETYHPKTVISLLNPKLPFFRELIAREKEYCKTLGIDFVSIPISFFSNKTDTYNDLKDLLNTSGVKKPIYIHAYLLDHRLELLEHRVIMKNKAIKGSKGDRDIKQMP